MCHSLHAHVVHPEQDRKQLLREWVHKNGDAAAVEASIVVSKSSSSKLGTQKELLTVQEMVVKGFPAEKISAIVAKGGIPDPDCPHLPSLYKYWCQTSCVLKDVEEVKQESKVTVKCKPDAAAVDALMSGPKGPAKRCALPTGCLEQMMQSTQSPGLGFSTFLNNLAICTCMQKICLLLKCGFVYICHPFQTPPNPCTCK